MEVNTSSSTRSSSSSHNNKTLPAACFPLKKIVPFPDVTSAFPRLLPSLSSSRAASTNTMHSFILFHQLLVEIFAEEENRRKRLSTETLPWYSNIYTHGWRGVMCSSPNSNSTHSGANVRFHFGAFTCAAAGSHGTAGSGNDRRAPLRLGHGSPPSRSHRNESDRFGVLLCENRRQLLFLSSACCGSADEFRRPPTSVSRRRRDHQIQFCKQFLFI